MKRILQKLSVLGCSTLLMAGCASVRHPKNPQDPYQQFNKKTFQFNAKLDKNFFKPVAKGYAKLVPQPARQGISNVFNNIDELTVIANDVLQGDYNNAMGDSWRFFINSTFGLFGIFDVASKMHVAIPKHNNDFGLTMANWGFTDQKYIVIPLFGPSTDVDILGRIVDFYAFSPYPYLHPYWRRATALGLYYLNERAQLLQFNDLYETAAINPYVFVRNAYLQRRKAQLENLQQNLKAEYSSLEDNQAGYFIKPSHPHTHQSDKAKKMQVE